uniref:Tryptophan synthase alpha chain n=1 Tax=Neogoniolithon spectabile TaxID=231755 RepID=A0A3G3MH20_9FLOR|nr:tryptophan synthase alpha subunit [Neogoniolithon spectabile]AYR06125.1 tryptophan synthase alpha subunit [Neogoniolithon spectabile]
MLAISDAIARTKNELAFIPFITVGYPNIDMTKEVIYILDQEQVDAIELGIPYSDALADGPIIQQASSRALSQDIHIAQVLSCIEDVKPKIKIPLIIFTYFNPILFYGLNRFVNSIAILGVKGLIIPDLPLEESEYLVALCNYYRIELIFFLSPTSSEKRVNSVIARAPGLIYLVSSYGVTGLKRGLTNRKILEFLTKSIKSRAKNHIILGFGISSTEQVNLIRKSEICVDGLVIGSALVDKITASKNSGSFEHLVSFCRNIKCILK